MYLKLIFNALKIKILKIQDFLVLLTETICFNIYTHMNFSIKKGSLFLSKELMYETKM